MIFQSQLLFLVLLICFVVSCGVKGPPLPPIAVTPQKADLMTRQPPQPQPQSTRSPAPKPESEGTQK